MNSSPDPGKSDPNFEHPWTAWAEAVRQQGEYTRRVSSELPRRHAVMILLGGILAIALAFPFYDYYVQSRLLQLELEAALQEAEAELKAQLEELGNEGKAQAERAEREARLRRLRLVRVTGVIDGEEPVAIVVLGDAHADEARQTICAQAQRQLRRSLQGQLIKVQRAQANRPATDAGWISCD